MGGCASSDGSSRWATSLPTVAVLSLSSETMGEPTPMKASAGARSVYRLSRCCRCYRKKMAADVPVVMEAATGTTSLPTDAVLSEMVSAPPLVTAVTVGKSLWATETTLSMLS